MNDQPIIDHIDSPIDRKLRRVVLTVAVANLVYFGVEFMVARTIGSVSLFADSIDFLEDTSVNLLILLALHLSVRNRARVGMLLAMVLLVPSLATLWSLWSKLQVFAAPTAMPLMLTSSGAFIVNLTCALLLARFRKISSSLVRAAFLSARNDVYANIAIVVVGVITSWTQSPWPDIVAGVGIAALNAGAANEVWEAARQERLSSLAKAPH